MPTKVEVGAENVHLHTFTVVCTSPTVTCEALPSWPTRMNPAPSCHLLIHLSLCFSHSVSPSLSHNTVTIPHCVGRQGLLMYESVIKRGKSKPHCSEICVCVCVCICICLYVCQWIQGLQVSDPWTPLNIFYIP